MFLNIESHKVLVFSCTTFLPFLNKVLIITVINIVFTIVQYKVFLRNTIKHKAMSCNATWGGGVLGSSFAGYVPLASQNPYPIIVYSVASYRPHLRYFWANVIVISKTEFNASRLLNTKTTVGTIFQPRIFLFLNPCLPEFSHPKIPKFYDPILVTLLKM